MDGITPIQNQPPQENQSYPPYRPPQPQVYQPYTPATPVPQAPEQPVIETPERQEQIADPASSHGAPLDSSHIPSADNSFLGAPIQSSPASFPVNMDVGPAVGPAPVSPGTPVMPPAPAPVAPSAVDDQVSYADAHIEEIDVTKIIPNPFQPRKMFDPDGLKELADSIREHGVIQPVVVTETPTGYELVVGERRFRASVLAGLSRVPAIVKKQLGDQTKLEVALIENIQRRELNPIEEAQAYDRLIKTFSLTQDQVAKKVGKSRPSVTNTLRLLNLPAEIQRAVIEGKLSEGHARAILGAPDAEKQMQVYNTVLEQGLNVRQVEAKVREITMRRAMDAVLPDPKFIALESELRGRLGTQVKISKQGQGGRITIDFFSEEELNDIIHKMSEIKEEQGSGYFTV